MRTRWCFARARWYGLLALAAAIGGVALLPSGASAAPDLSRSNCHLDRQYKHVIYIQYDNTHLSRDNPNVPSDLEQVPALKNFLAGRGTLSGNEHTPLISHTAGDIVTSLTGLYPDRNGIGVSNSYLQYQPGTGQIQKTPTGGFFSPTAFTYWTDPVSSSSIVSPTDQLPNLITDGQQNTPAPWVPYTRAGCDVGAFSIADMELENTGPDIASAFGPSSPQFAFTSAQTSKAAQAFAAADFEGIAVHCARADSVSGKGNEGICSPANGGVADTLPNEPGGYSGYNALFGGIYANQVTSAPGSFTPSTQDGNGAAHGNIPDLAAPVNDVYSYSFRHCRFCANGTNLGYNGQPITTQKITDNSGNSGFVSGFSPTPAQTLGYVASMQEAGIPVTFAYIEDAHAQWTPPYNALGPGQAQYVDQLKQENQAYQAFFERLARDGINQRNTLFVFTADEGDHFAGTQPNNPGCDGVTTACTYDANAVGEQTVEIQDALAKELGDTNPFDIHFDDAANFYVHGAPGSTAPPGPYDTSVRQLEQDLGKLTLTNAVSGATDHVTQHLADAEDQKILHMTTTDPLRTPTFTDFGNPTYFYQTYSCGPNTPPGCPTVNPAYAWNHGGDQPEVTTTWLGMVGPTVRRLGQRGSLVWSDHTDIRPTMLTLLGLQSSYVDDGRALTEFMTRPAQPDGVRADPFGYQRLAALYKQLDAAVGEFGHDSEIVSTTAAESVSPGDVVARGFDQQLQACQTARDALAATIKSDLNAADFAGVPVTPSEAATLGERAWVLIGEMHYLSQQSTLPTQTVCS